MIFDKKDSNIGMNYEISCFEWKDIEIFVDQIIDMQLENTYKFHYPEKMPNRDYIKKKILEIKNHMSNNNTYLIGAKMDDKLYGYIWAYESIFIDEKRMNINSLIICEEARGTGLGRLLMNELKKISKDNSCDSIVTLYASFNTSAGDFYYKNEFNPVRIEMVCKL
jgi:GNAT superfamily N-acetyltransferase